MLRAREAELKEELATLEGSISKLEEQRVGSGGTRQYRNAPGSESGRSR